MDAETKRKTILWRQNRQYSVATPSITKLEKFLRFFHVFIASHILPWMLPSVGSLSTWCLMLRRRGIVLSVEYQKWLVRVSYAVTRVGLGRLSASTARSHMPCVSQSTMMECIKLRNRFLADGNIVAVVVKHFMSEYFAHQRHIHQTNDWFNHIRISTFFQFSLFLALDNSNWIHF